MNSDRCALVLGGGGMFGAYQAGVWQVLAPHFQPGLFAGASIGALNAWVMSSGCPPQDWARVWQDLDPYETPRFRFPRSPLAGCVDRQCYEALIQRIHTEFQPKTPCAIALTDLLRLKPWLAVTPNVEWVHLAASCAVFGIMPQYRIEGRWTTDGGILGSVPLWAAEQLGYRKIVAVNILPRGGPWWLRAARAAVRGLSGHIPKWPDGVEVVWIEHAGPLGTPREAFVWSPSSARRLLEWGRADAEAALDSVRRLSQTF